MLQKRKVKNLQNLVKYLKTFQEDKNSDKIILMTKTTDLPKDFEHIWNIINEDKIKPKIGMFERD